VAGSAKGERTGRLLITGAAGNMGRLLRPRLRRDDRVLRLADIRPIEDLQPGEEFMPIDVTDVDTLAKACQDVDAILHLGGISVEGRFEDVLDVNVTGTHNLLRAAVDSGVGKVLLASSNHAVGFYRRSDIPPGHTTLPDDLSPRPDTYYGWSKAAIESMGALFHHRYGLDVIALRIGTCFAEPADTRALSTWLAPADAAALIDACLTETASGFKVIWAVSDNARRWWSLRGAEALGYQSREDAEVFAADRIAAAGEPDPTEPVHQLVGGAYCLAPLGEPM
jgi:nucleoside-diphosphate-sugar epimerase